MRRLAIVLCGICMVSAALAARAANVTVAAREPDAERAAPVPAKLPPAWEFSEVLGAQPDLARGAITYETCGVCHGSDGGGQADGTVPRLAGQHYRVLVKQLVDFRNARRWDYRMEHFADRHHLPRPQDVADVAAYAAQLRPSGASAIGNGEALNGGASLYFQRCQSCHGSLGQGSNGKLVPRLAGQQYAYLVRQLHDAAEGRRPGLSASHGRLVRGFDKAQIDGIADYLSRSLDTAAGASASKP